MDKIKVLIVDDSIFQISILKDLLTENGYEVVGQASNLEEVITEVKDKKPTLVTMDMTMPGTDGIECTKEIKKIDRNIKVIVVSSMMDEEIIHDAKKAGAEGYVQKPVDADELITNIERIVSTEKLYETLDNSYMSTFRESLANNLNLIARCIPTYGEEIHDHETKSSRGMCVVIGITGKFTGRLIVDMPKTTAESIAKTAVKRELKNSDECLQIMSEFVNMIAGNGCSILNRQNKAYGFRVSPPTIFHGSSLNISKTVMDTTTVIAETQFGEILLNIGFQKE